MKVLIYVSVLMIVGLGLLLFDDVEVGLPVLNIAVWIVVAVTGVFLVARLHGRSRARGRSRRSGQSRGSSSRHLRVHHASAERKLSALPDS